ncbi:hypothetical protein EVAR_50647_1 [Eumeta japonica]|uniref:Uncharacterized protein n=1 Tax=Eumeta variegata TaxID=151549 RepID=A0A4C1XKL6_EUMVA|nr:hypothetical protein EVAR_50647_1 [Eumeta japonica]
MKVAIESNHKAIAKKNELQKNLKCDNGVETRTGAVCCEINVILPSSRHPGSSFRPHGSAARGAAAGAAGAATPACGAAAQRALGALAPHSITASVHNI